jgi:anti-sigma factor ChrR (cupin superfamily)
MSAITPKSASHASLKPLSSRFVDVAALPWEKTRHPGVETKALVTDPASGLATLLTRLAPGARIPDHEHVLLEQTFVLEGALHCDEGVCKSGDFVWRPTGSRHEAWAGPEGCLALAIFQMPNRFYEAGGRVVDFLGNDWETAWGPKLKAEGGSRKAKESPGAA